MASLAFAGVTLPNPAQSAFESVGVNLPNQSASDDDPSDDQAVEDKAKETGAEGTSQGNSAAAHRHAIEQRKKARGKAIGHTRGKAIGLNELKPPGHTGDTGQPEQSNSGGGGSAHSQSAPGRLKQTLPPQSRGRGIGRN
jgi:hypothetical protein